MIRRLLPAAATCVAAAFSCAAAALAPTPSPPPGFSGVIGVVSGAAADTPATFVAGGDADRVRRIAMTPTTRFRLASLTKTVTAVLVLKAVDEGRIGLDRPLANAIPGVAAAVRQVTPRQLLQHTSGLANPNDGVPDDQVPPFYTRLGPGADDQGAAARGACSAKPKAAPGAGFSYNNCDYVVLGALLEQLYGKPYAALVQDRISRPLHLSWRMAPATPDPRNRIAKGYDEKGEAELFQNPAAYGASGGLIGTVGDVLAFDRALMDGRLLSPARLADLTTADPKLYGEALSLWSYDVDLGCGRKAHLWERQGDIGGTRLLNLVVPAEKIALVIATNTARDDLFDTYSRKGLGYASLRSALGVSCPAATS